MDSLRQFQEWNAIQLQFVDLLLNLLFSASL